MDIAPPKKVGQQKVKEDQGKKGERQANDL